MARAICKKTDVSHTHMERVALTGAYLNEANFSFANLTGATLFGTSATTQYSIMLSSMGFCMEEFAT